MSIQYGECEILSALAWSFQFFANLNVICITLVCATTCFVMFYFRPWRQCPQRNTEISKVKRAAQNIDAHKVSSTPNCWVFDDLVDTEFLDWIDQQFEQEGRVDNVKPHPRDKDIKFQGLRLPVTEHPKLFNTLATLSHIDPIRKCDVYIINDVWGTAWDPHIDYVWPLEKLSDKTQLRMEQQQSKPSGQVVPTYTYVVYFNDVGSVSFPESSLEVKGKRGRIIMWENYNESHNSLDPFATHIGSYEFQKNTPKRIAVFGSVQNKNSILSKSHHNFGLKEPGMIVSQWGGPWEHSVMDASGTCEIMVHHLNDQMGSVLTHKQFEYRSRQKKGKSKRDPTRPDAEMDDDKSYEGKHNPYFIPVEARVRGRPEYFSTDFRINKNSLINREWAIDSNTCTIGIHESSHIFQSCENRQDEMIMYLLLKNLHMPDHFCGGWMCKCKYCSNREETYNRLKDAKEASDKLPLQDKVTENLLSSFFMNVMNLQEEDAKGWIFSSGISLLLEMFPFTGFKEQKREERVAIGYRHR